MVTEVKTKAQVLDGHDYYDLKRAAKFLAEGEAIVMPICGVMGFVCDATSNKGVDQIYELKGRDRSQQLITAGSTPTRKQLVAWEKFHPKWHGFDFSLVYDLPIFVIFPAKEHLPEYFVRPDQDGVPTVAVWWANHYSPTINLERLLQGAKRDSFIGGSSCNRSKEESITVSHQAIREFGDGVAAIVCDSRFDRGDGLITGSHTMLRLEGDRIRPLRGGSVHVDSFKQSFGDRLEIPEGFQNPPNAALLDLKEIQQQRHYFKLRFPRL